MGHAGRARSCNGHSWQLYSPAKSDEICFACGVMAGRVRSTANNSCVDSYQPESLFKTRVIRDSNEPRASSIENVCSKFLREG